MKSTTKRVQLNWSKLLGFSQVKSSPSCESARAAIGVKLGVKVGVKPPPANN